MDFDYVRQGIARLRDYLAARFEVDQADEVNIVVVWDTDDDTELPVVVEISADLYALDRSGDGQEVADWLSEKYHFCVEEWHLST